MRVLLIHQFFLEKDGAGGSRFNEMTRIWGEMGHEITVLAGMVNYASGKKADEYRGKYFAEEQISDKVNVLRCHVSESYNVNFLGRLWGYFSFVFSSIWGGLFKIKGPFDVIFANAVLQWVPNHAALLPALAGKLAEGGSLAIQMPDNLNEPSHRLMREVAANGPWASKLADAAGQRTDMASASEYFSMLRPQCARVDVWRTTYHHQLSDGAAGVVEWFKGSGLIPFLSPLTESERAQYLEQYLAEVEKAYPALADGSVLLPFPRLFMVATR